LRYSQISDYYRCPRYYELRHIKKVPSGAPASAALHFGTACHLGVETFFEGGDGEAVFEAVSNLTLCITSYGFAIRAGLTIMEKYTRAFEVRDNYIHGFVEKHESGRFIPDLRVYETIEVEEDKPIAKVEAKDAPIKV